MRISPMTTRTHHDPAYLTAAPTRTAQVAPFRKKATFLQGVREDYHLAESMAYACRLRGESVTNLSDDELMAKVRAAYVPR
jgi:hypothetical protein